MARVGIEPPPAFSDLEIRTFSCCVRQKPSTHEYSNHADHLTLQFAVLTPSSSGQLAIYIFRITKPLIYTDTDSGDKTFDCALLTRRTPRAPDLRAHTCYRVPSSDFICNSSTVSGRDSGRRLPRPFAPS